MDVKRTLVMWDWDGTLVDSEASLKAALQDLMTHTGLPPITQADVVDVMHNHKGAFWTERFGDNFISAFEYFLGRFEHHNAQKELQVYEGSIEAIRWLKSHGIPQIVVSNKPQYLLDEECNRLGLHPYFMRVFGTQPNDDDKKPNATFAKRVLQDLFYNQLIMVGDSQEDMDFARHLNAVAVYVQNPPLPNVSYNHHVPHMELLDFMQNHFCARCG